MKEMPKFEGEFGGGNEGGPRKVPVDFSPEEPEMEVPIEQREPEGDAEKGER